MIHDAERQARLAVESLLDETECETVTVRLPKVLVDSYRQAVGEDLSVATLSAYLASPPFCLRAAQDHRLRRLADMFLAAIRGSLHRYVDAQGERRRTP